MGGDISIFLISIAISISAHAQELIFETNFETVINAKALVDRDKDLFKDGVGGTFRSIFQNVNPRCLEVVTAPVREGKQAMKFLINDEWDYSAHDDKNKPRVDLSHPSTTKLIAQETDYWIGFSIYVPTNYPFDYSENETQVFETQHISAGGGGPQALIIAGTNWIYHIKWNPINYFQHDLDYKNNVQKIDLGKIEKGVWTDFLVHINLCWQKGCPGVTEVWLNGNSVVNWLGPNSYNTTGVAPYFKVDVANYKGGWRKFATKVHGEQYIYFDSVRAARGANVRSLVDVRTKLQKTLSPPQAVKVD